MSKTSRDKDRQTAKAAPLRAWHAAVALAAGLAVSAGVFLLMQRSKQESILAEFRQRAGNRVHTLRGGIKKQLEVLRALRDLYNSSERVERDEFDRFADALLRRNRGIEVLVWIQRERPRPGLWPEPGGESMRIAFARATNGARTPLGEDLWPNPSCRAAMQQALRTRKATLASCRSVQRSLGNGFENLVLLPFVRSADAPAQTVLYGFVGAGFRTDHLLHDLSDGVDLGGIEVFVQTDCADGRGTVVYEKNGRVVLNAAAQDLRRIRDGLHREDVIELAGEPIQILCRPTPQFLRRRESWAAWLALGAGVVISGLLAGVLWVAAGRAAGTHQFAAAQQRINLELQRQMADRRRAESALTESQRTLTTLMSNLPGMAYRCRNDPAWTMEFVSGGSLQLTGYRPAQLIRSAEIAYGDVIVPDDRPMVWRTVQQALETRRSFQMNYRIHTADGGTKWVWEQGQGVYGADGELVALEGFIMDVTEQRRLLEQAQADAELRKALLGELNHRVKNNLATISSLLYLELTKPTQDKDHFIASCMRRVESLSELHAILSERISEKVSVHTLIQRVATATVSGSPPPHPEVTIETPGQDPRIPADMASGLAMAASELIANALRHGLARTERPRLRVRVTMLDSTCTLEVVDNGPGLPEGFDITTDGGTGLNLVWYIARKQLNGSIEFTREGDELRATLTFKLP